MMKKVSFFNDNSAAMSNREAAGGGDRGKKNHAKEVTNVMNGCAHRAFSSVRSCVGREETQRNATQ